MTPRILPLALAFLAIAASLPTAIAEGDEPEESDAEDTSREVDAEIDEDPERDDKESDDEEADDWEEERRELDLRTREDGFEYESSRRSALGEDQIQAGYKVDDATFYFEYESNAPQETQLRFRVQFMALAEHEDLDADAEYDVGEPVLNRIDIRSLPRPITTQTQQGDVATVSVAYTLPAGGSLVFRFHVAPQQASVDGTPLKATEAKYDVLVTDHAWQSSTSRLFLETRARTTLEANVDDDSQPGLEFTNGTIQGYYRWLKTSVVDGASRSVGVSVLATKTSHTEDEAEGESIVVFSYAHGASIMHDPSLGVQKVTETITRIIDAVKGDWRVWSASALAAVALVAVTAIPRLRRT